MAYTISSFSNWVFGSAESPGILAETKAKGNLLRRMLPAMVDIIGEVLDKQSEGLPLLPMNATGSFELIYTAAYHYMFNFERTAHVGPCITSKSES